VTGRPSKNIAASVRQRLLNKAKETGRTFSELLQYFAMERFLYRLSKSRYADRDCDLVEKPFCEQLKGMGWDWLEGDTGVPKLTERENFREVPRAWSLGR
jgi:hypothetical protein